MFSYSEKLSILPNTEIVESLDLRVDGSGNPMLSWMESVADARLLKFVYYDGSEWNFRDHHYKLHRSLTSKGFVEISSTLYLLYDYFTDATGSTMELAFSTTDLGAEGILTETVLDSGDIWFSSPLVYSSSPYFLYAKGDTLYIRDALGSLDKLAISNLTFTTRPDKIVAAYSARYLIVMWTELSDATLVIKSKMFDLFTEAWLATNTIGTYTVSQYDLVCAHDSYNDGMSPPVGYKPFYAVLSYTHSNALFVVSSYHATDGTSTQAVIYSQSKAGYVSAFDVAPVLGASVYDAKGFVSIVCEDLFLLRSNDVTTSFSRVSAPGLSFNTRDISNVQPFVSGSTLHFVYASDNIVYGNLTFEYSAYKAQRQFVLSDGVSVYNNGSSVSDLAGHSLVCLVDDSVFSPSLGWVISASDHTKVKGYDFESGQFVPDFEVDGLVSYAEAVFDRRYARLYVCDKKRSNVNSHDGGALTVYDVGSDVTSRYTTIDTQEFHLPLSVAVGHKRIAVADAGNHRILLFDRDSLDFLRLVTNVQMRFPFKVMFGLSGQLLIRCFDPTSLGSKMIKMNLSGDILATYPDYSLMGWGDVCNSTNANGLIVLEAGTQSSRGVHILSSDGSKITSRRITGNNIPSQFAVGRVFGDSVVMFSDRTLKGFLPDGTDTGTLTIEGISPYVTSVSLYREFLVWVKGDENTIVYRLRHSVDEAELQRIGTFLASDFLIDRLWSTLFASDLIASQGTVIKRYSWGFESVKFTRDMGFVPIHVEEFETNSLLMVVGSSKIVLLGVLAGDLRGELTGSFLSARIDKTNEIVYTLSSGGIVRKYTLQLVAGLYSFVFQGTVTLPGVTKIEVQHSTGKLWASTDKRIYLLHTDLTTEKQTAVWSNIAGIQGVNYAMAVYGSATFDTDEKASHSPGSRTFGVLSLSSSNLVVVDDRDNSYFVTNLVGYTPDGVSIDDTTGQIFVTALDGSANNKILQIDPVSGDIIRALDSPSLSGHIWVLGGGTSVIAGRFSVLDSDLNVNEDFLGNFTAVSSAGANLPVTERPDEKDPYYTFEAVQGDKHFSTRYNNLDVWHFRHTGLSGTRMSVDPQLSFDASELGTLRKAPVFTWDFDSDGYLDSLLVTDGTTASRYSLRPTSVSLLNSILEPNTITSLLAIPGYACSVSGGYLVFYDYETFLRVNYKYVAGDAELLTYRNGYVWLGSRSRGEMWRYDVPDCLTELSFDAEGSPIALKWSDFSEKYILIRENSVCFFDAVVGAYAPFYDVSDYHIVNADIHGDKIFMALNSYDSIPNAGAYDTIDEFVTAADARKVDQIAGLTFEASEYDFRYELPYNVEIVDVVYRENSGAVGLGVEYDNGLRVKCIVYEVDADGDLVTSYVHPTPQKPLGLIRLAVSGKIVATFPDGSYIDWSSGTVQLVSGLGGDSSSSSKSSSSSSSAASNSSSSSSSAFSQSSSSSSSLGLGLKIAVVGLPEKIPASSSGTSDSTSSESGQSVLRKMTQAQVYESLQILVGDTEGQANRWDSGPIDTAKKQIVYGGGDNLEPGQRYFVAVRCKKDGIWTEYQSWPFIMPHWGEFEPYPSSSSSSSATVGLIEPLYNLVDGDVLDLDTTTPFSYRLDGEDGDTAIIVFDCRDVVIGIVDGRPVWDLGGPGEEYFDYNGESFIQTICGQEYAISSVDIASNINSVVFTTYVESSSSSFSSSSSSLSSLSSSASLSFSSSCSSVTSSSFVSSSSSSNPIGSSSSSSSNPSAYMALYEFPPTYEVVSLHPGHNSRNVFVLTCIRGSSPPAYRLYCFDVSVGIGRLDLTVQDTLDFTMTTTSVATGGMDVTNHGNVSCRIYITTESGMYYAEYGPSGFDHTVRRDLKFINLRWDSVAAKKTVYGHDIVVAGSSLYNSITTLTDHTSTFSYGGVLNFGRSVAVTKDDYWCPYIIVPHNNGTNSLAFFRIQETGSVNYERDFEHDDPTSTQGFGIHCAVAGGNNFVADYLVDYGYTDVGRVNVLSWPDLSPSWCGAIYGLSPSTEQYLGYYDIDVSVHGEFLATSTNKGRVDVWRIYDSGFPMYAWYRSYYPVRYSALDENRLGMNLMIQYVSGDVIIFSEPGHPRYSTDIIYAHVL